MLGVNESGGGLAFWLQGELVVGLRQKGPHEARALCCPTLALQNKSTAWMMFHKSKNKEISKFHYSPKGKLDAELHL